MEVWLTSEDLGAYGHDIGVSLPDLLWQLVAVIPNNAMLRLGMTNPPYIMQHMEVSGVVGVASGCGLIWRKIAFVVWSMPTIDEPLFHGCACVIMSKIR